MGNTIIIAGAIVIAAIIVAAIFFGNKLWKLPTWLQTTLIGVFAAGMFVFIWYVQKEGQKQEAVFMGICWDAAGEAHYPEDGVGDARCDEAAPLDWKGYPKKVYWDLPEDFNTYRSSFEHALGFWNDALGTTVVVETEDREAVDILIEWGDASSSGAMAASHRRTADGIKSRISVRKPGDIRIFMLHLEHELGHALFGLAHDRGRSIMNPKAGEGEDEQMQVWFVTDKDKREIKRTLE